MTYASEVPTDVELQTLLEQRRALRELAVAGITMMQVGMFAIALHAGELQGIEQQYRHHSHRNHQQQPQLSCTPKPTDD